MSYAIIDASVVVNIVKADSTFAAAQGWVEVPVQTPPVAIGDSYDSATGTFTSNVSIPEMVDVLEPDYIGFWLALVSSTAYANIRSSASTDLAVNVAATEFIAVIGDAKTGNVNETLMQGVINALINAADPDATDRAELEALLAGYDLSYTLPAAA